MSCSFPPELTDEQLMVVLDGESSPDVRQHLIHCTHCRSRFEKLYQFEVFLRRKLRRRDCPTSDALRDYALALPQTERELIASHVEQCPRCKAEIEELHEFLQAEEPTPAYTVLPAVHRPRPNQLYPQIYQGSPVLEMRGGKDSETLLLEADGGVMIFLEAQPESGGATLMGRLLAPDMASWANALVEIKQAGGMQTASIVDDSGLFNCRLKSTGSISLWVTSQAGITLIIDEIEIET